MPIYEYACGNPKCGHQFEVIQKMSDDPISTCPECRSKKVSKMVSAAGFVLKGSGWYKTDIAGKEKAAKDKREGKKDSSSEAPAAACGGGACGTGGCAAN
jgi:putative FmdB family regulatory protein